MLHARTLDRMEESILAKVHSRIQKVFQSTWNPCTVCVCVPAHDSVKFIKWVIKHHTRDMGSSPALERSPGEGNGNPLQYP